MQVNKYLKTKPFTLRARANSFRFAWEGLYRFFAGEHNAWVHAVATAVVFLMAYVLDVSRTELILLIMVTGFVWFAEMINTAIEKIMDLVEPAYHPEVKFIKDLAAGAVLVAAIISLLTGSIIFIPKLI